MIFLLLVRVDLSLFLFPFLFLSFRLCLLDSNTIQHTPFHSNQPRKILPNLPLQECTILFLFLEQLILGLLTRNEKIIVTVTIVILLLTRLFPGSRSSFDDGTMERSDRLLPQHTLFFCVRNWMLRGR